MLLWLLSGICSNIIHCSKQTATGIPVMLSQLDISVKTSPRPLLLFKNGSVCMCTYIQHTQTKQAPTCLGNHSHKVY